MSRNTRFVIPGRPGEGEGRDLHKAMFGDAAAEGDEAPAQRPRVQMRERPANDEPEAEPDFGDDDGFDRPFTDRAGDRRKGADRRKGYSRLPDHARGYRPPEDNKRGVVILGVAVLILAVFAAVVWNTYRNGLKSPDGAVEPELAAAGPFKSRPEGAAKTRASEEASVFERREAAPSVTEDAESTPEVRPAAPAPKEEATAKPAAAAPPPAKPVEAAATKPAAPVVATKPAPAPAKPAATPVQTAQTPKAPSAPVSLAGGEFKPAFKPGGGFAVQLAASSTEEGAASEWTRRTAKAPDLFASAERMIVKADVNGRTVYRVRAGSFATAADADAFCGALKARGGECFRAVK